jgi:hypothetical protein
LAQRNKMSEAGQGGSALRILDRCCVPLADIGSPAMMVMQRLTFLTSRGAIDERWLG